MAVDGLSMQFYSAIHPRGPCVRGIQFYMGNPGLIHLSGKGIRGTRKTLLGFLPIFLSVLSSCQAFLLDRKNTGELNSDRTDRRLTGTTAKRKPLSGVPAFCQFSLPSLRPISVPFGRESPRETQMVAGRMEGLQDHSKRHPESFRSDATGQRSLGRVPPKSL